MSRTPSQGDAAIDRDAQSLLKIKRRITLDRHRTDAEKQKLESLLVELITLLINGKRGELVPVEKAAGSKSR